MIKTFTASIAIPVVRVMNFNVVGVHSAGTVLNVTDVSGQPYTKVAEGIWYSSSSDVFKIDSATVTISYSIPSRASDTEAGYTLKEIVDSLSSEFYKLWPQHADRDGYDKKAWQRLEALILMLSGVDHD